MFEFIKKIFGKKKDMRFDIMVYSEDDEGNYKERQENGVHAASERELHAIYAACDEKIQVINRYDDPQTDAQRDQMRQRVLSKLQNTNPEMMQYVDRIDKFGGNVLEGSSKNKQMITQKLLENNNTQSQQIQPQQINQTPPSIFDLPPQVQVQQAAPVIKQPPKFYKIGNIECKIEDGKMYQKQWVVVADGDNTNYRLINDTNNKIISLSGKHIEMLKWVQVQDQEGE